MSKNAHNVSRVGLAKVSGRHLSEAANEPTEADWIAADLAYLQGQKERDQRRVEEVASLERAYVQRRGWLL